MKKWISFAALILGTFGVWASAVAQTPPEACNRAQNLNWIQQFFGDNPVIQTSVQNNVRTQKNRLCGRPGVSDPLAFPVELPPPQRSVPNQPWEEVAGDLSGFVNVYRLSGNADYKDLAKFAADWLLAWNDYLVAHADPSIPYLGWHVASRQGYFNLTCAADHQFRDAGDNRSYFVDGWRADEAWDTAAAVRSLIKYSEIDPDGMGSPYFQRAQSILENWPYRDHASDDGNPDTPDLVNDGPYAAAGLRWYMKSNEPCEIRYVKNTDIVMGEQLFRTYRLTQDPKYLQAATKVLDAQLWDIVSHLNFGYNSYMIRVDRSDEVYSRMVTDDDLNKIDHKPDGSIVCKEDNVSCWNHLGFEAYDLYLIQQLISDLPPDAFPVPSTQADVAQAISQTIENWRTSRFGDPDRYPWVDPPKGASPTHVTAYNCALRFSDDASYLTACVKALGHSPSGGTIFYSLVPDTILTQGAAN